MKGLVSNFDGPLLAAIVTTAAILLAAAALAIHRRRVAQPWLVPAARVMAVGAAVVAMIATALPDEGGFRSDGDLVLRPGDGGLGDLDQIMADPTSLAAVLLAANIVLFIPVAFMGVVGWFERRYRVVAGCLGLSVLVEASQFAFLGRVAATDDVILNMIGTILGFLGATASLGWARGRRARTRGRRHPL